MRLASMMALCLLAGAPARAADDHLVSRDAMGQALRAKEDVVQRDLATLDGILASEKAAAAAQKAGLTPGDLRAGVRTLSPAEIHDLAERASRLQTDPRSGLTHDVEELLIIFLIVGLVIIIIKSA